MTKEFRHIRTFDVYDHSKLYFLNNQTIETQHNPTQEISYDHTPMHKRYQDTKRIERQNTADNLFHLRKTSECLLNKEDLTCNVMTININKPIDDSCDMSKTPPLLKRSSQLWTKARNIQKMVNAFLRPSIVKIDDKIIMSSTFRDSLLGDSNVSKNTLIKQCENTQINEKPKVIPLGIFLMKTEVEKGLIRVAIKEKAYQLLIDGSSTEETAIEEMDKLFEVNPEKNMYVSSSKHYLFNQLLTNGKTLLYVACQEGNLELVIYFINKGLNPNIKVKYAMLEDCCLWVACRWGYYSIVSFLLQNGMIDFKDIKAMYSKNNCNKKIKKLLKNYISLHNSNKKDKGCLCF